MPKQLYFFIFALLHVLAVSAQISTELNGTIIGTELSVDYSTGSSSKTVNTKQNVFDNDFTTYFASYARSGTWVGLDLGSKHVITKIGYSPRISQPSRVQLAILEGANSPDFSDALPLYIIPGPASENTMTHVDISCSRGFRYVRYVTPSDVRCNLAELEFFGYPGEGNDSKLYQITNLPTVTVHTENSQDVIVKDLYLNAIVSIVSNNGTNIFADSTRIKGRGNASWNFPKKPYKLKLNNKASLLGLPANAREWTLINNYGDKTLMRNILAFGVSKFFDMAYTPAGMCVDVILNGEYKGTYQLCDQIEVRKNRVDIDEMEDTDTEFPNVTGGYLIEVDAYAPQEISWFTSGTGIPVTIKYPDEDDIHPSQKRYITDHFNKMEKQLFADYNSEDRRFSQYLDTESFFKNFLIGEFCGNTDTYWSTYMYKYRNNDTIYTGPIWDYDLAFENDRRTYPINSLNDFLYRTKGSNANGMKRFVDNTMSSDASKKELHDLWFSVRESKITNETMTKMVDSLATHLNASQALNFLRWPIMNTIVHENPAIHGSYQNEVNAVKNYISNRILWMDEMMLSLKPTEIKEPEKPAEGKIYAVNSTLTIQDFKYNMSFIIYNLSGQIERAGSIKAGDNYSTSLFPGVYLIELEDKIIGEKIQKKVFIKN